MNPDAACETPPEDLIRCLIEYLRRSDARLKVEGELWSACFGVGDPLNKIIADRLENSIAAPAKREPHSTDSYVDGSGSYQSWRGGAYKD